MESILIFLGVVVLVASLLFLIGIVVVVGWGVIEMYASSVIALHYEECEHLNLQLTESHPEHPWTCSRCGEWF